MQGHNRIREEASLAKNIAWPIIFLLNVSIALILIKLNLFVFHQLFSLRVESKPVQKSLYPTEPTLHQAYVKVVSHKQN